MTHHNQAKTATKRPWLSLCITIVLIAGSLWAGTTGKISGLVVDQETGNPLPGANVIIENTVRGASSDAEGFFYILNVPPGNYSVRATVIGYRPMAISNVRVTADHTTNLHFDLQSTVIEGEEVLVTADRPIVEHDVTGSQNIMDIGYMGRAPIADLSDAISQQTGIQSTGETTWLRGGLPVETNYILDGTSLNSGIISDNYQRLNITAVQEITVMTGGYNAEYGQAMSGVVNVITREASTTRRGIHGSFRYKMRPAGQYHWGKNMYDKTLLRYTDFDLEHWTEDLASRPQWYANYYRDWYGAGTPTDDASWDGTRVPTAQEIQDTFDEQMTPDPILGKYAERSQQEFEGSLYGSLFNNMSFLISGRYLKGVNIYPQAMAYNPEYNVQVKLDYHLSRNMKLSLNVLRGWYKSASYTESNWNNMESAQEARWQPNAEVRSPYWEDFAFGPWGGVWEKGPQEKDFYMASLNWHHTLSPSTFYNVQVSTLSDYMTEFHDYSKVEQSLDILPWGDTWYDLSGRYRLAARYVALGNQSDSKVTAAKADLVSQVSRSHQLKAGGEMKLYNLDYVHYWMEFAGGDIWHLDNVWDGKPVDLVFFLQDKIEYPGSGIIANIGLRFDAFNTNKTYAGSVYDPLARQPWNGGDGTRPSNLTEFWPANQLPIDWFPKEGATADDYRELFPDSARVNKNTVKSEWKKALAPRIGISFPVTANSKLRFNYGHFYQRPSWSKLMGFPISWYENNPYNTARMDRWMGWYGNPGLEYEKMIQYEIGYTRSIMDIIRLDLTAYYKDASNLTRFGYSGAYNFSGGINSAATWGTESWQTFAQVRSNAGYDGHDNVVYTNNAYRDSRGIEATVEKVFNGVWSARLVANYGINTGGVNGSWLYNEDSTYIDMPHSYAEAKSIWLSNLTFKGDISFVTPKDLGPFGLLGDISMGFYYEWFRGPEYTYYPDDYTGLQRPNNKTWYPHRRGDLKLKKRFNLAGVSPVLGLEVYNLFNDYDWHLLGGTDLEFWEEGEFDEEGNKIRAHRPPQAGVTAGGETEDDDWWFYNSSSNPKRMIYLTLSLEI
jgi:hypothetical protein